MNVRCKFKVTNIETAGDGVAKVTLDARYDETIDEDQRFFKWTPSGSLQFLCSNPVVLDRIAVGQDYYVDLVPVVSSAARAEDFVIVEGPNEHGAVRTAESVKYTEDFVLEPKLLTLKVDLTDQQRATIQSNCGCDHEGNIGTVDPARLTRIKLHTQIMGLCYEVKKTWRDSETGKLMYREGTNYLPNTIGNRYTESGAATGPGSVRKFNQALAAGVLK